MSEVDLTLEKNRDCSRQNKASSIIDATIYTHMATDGILSIQHLCEEILNCENNQLTNESAKQLRYVTNLTKTTIEALNTSTKKFLKSSTDIKGGAKILASKEYTVLKKGFKFDELDIIPTRMDHYHPHMVKLQKVIFDSPGKLPCHNALYNIEAPCTTSVPTQLPPISPSKRSYSSISSPVTPSPKKRCISSTFSIPFQPIIHPSTNTLPCFTLVRPMSKFYSPMQAVKLIANNADFKLRRMMDLKKDNEFVIGLTSPFAIMTIMLKKHYVPVEKTTLFNLYNEYKSTRSLKYHTWIDTSTTGTKPHLSEEKVQELIQLFKDSTEGGASKSKADVITQITQEIKKQWNEKYKETYKHERIPEPTLRKYVNRVMGLPALNIFKSVANKTESRAAAEHSIRSTVSYVMTVLSTHYINAPPSKWHKSKKECEKDPLYHLVKKLNMKVLGVDEANSEEHEFTYTLPNLVTSTDECTMFFSGDVIHDKEVWHLSFRPSANNRPFKDSSQRNVYSTTQSGDAHHRGLRITLNNTFTAGGLCAPVFACIYGLTDKEMPKDGIVVQRVKGLVAGSDMTGSTQEGFLVFIRGNYEPNDEVEVEVQVEDTSPSTDLPNQGPDPSPPKMCKEAQVAKLYKELVYYPLIHHIRKAFYDMNDDDDYEIPENLQAISWMDGCHGQLYLTTQEDMMKLEAKLKIICNKQSAARTAVEQAADIGAMFKLLKKIIKNLPGGKACNPRMYFVLKDLLDQLEASSSSQVVILPAHKKRDYFRFK